MKSTFLASSAQIGTGMTKVTLRDVNGGDGFNDFRAGSNTGDIKIDLFGDAAAEITPGKTYLLSLEEFAEPAATADENSNTSSGSTIAQITGAVPAGPQSFTFNDQLSVVVENGVATLQIFGQVLTAKVDTESEDNADTQDQPSDNIIPIAGNVDTNVDTKDQTNTGADSEADTNTQGNAGPAAGAESTENSGTVDTNTDNTAV